MQKTSKIELKHQFEKCEFRGFMLRNCMKMHGAKNIKCFTDVALDCFSIWTAPSSISYPN